MNLLGLTELSIIATKLKLTKNIDEAMKSCEEAVENLKVLNAPTKPGSKNIGIASQNLIEELLDNLLKIKSKDLDVDEIANSYSPVYPNTVSNGGNTHSS